MLNSACLELFEFIKRENIKILIQHLVETYREKLQPITYVDTFQNLILRYDQMHEPVTTQELEASFTSVDSDTPARQQLMVNGGKWGVGLKEPDPDEEAYFNASDDEDELSSGVKSVNGVSPVRPLVNYPDDDEGEDDVDDLAAATPSTLPQSIPATPEQESQSTSKSPPERLSEKRRREEDEDDELLLSISSSGSKRRASLNSNSSAGSVKSLRRKGPNIAAAKDNGGGPKKMSLSIPLKSTGDGTNGE